VSDNVDCVQATFPVEELDKRQFTVNPDSNLDRDLRVPLKGTDNAPLVMLYFPSRQVIWRITQITSWCLMQVFQLDLTLIVEAEWNEICKRNRQRHY
jgi:hypothetical protein